jgi:hypothetical protein
VQLPVNIEIVDRALQGAILSTYHGPSIFSSVQDVMFGNVKLLSKLNNSFSFGERGGGNGAASASAVADDDAAVEAVQSGNNIDIELTELAIKSNTKDQLVVSPDRSIHRSAISFKSPIQSDLPPPTYAPVDGYRTSNPLLLLHQMATNCSSALAGCSTTVTMRLP